MATEQAKILMVVLTVGSKPGLLDSPSVLCLLDNEFSSPVPDLSVVPQGTLLGPLMFLLYKASTHHSVCLLVAVCFIWSLTA